MGEIGSLETASGQATKVRPGPGVKGQNSKGQKLMFNCVMSKRIQIIRETGFVHNTCIQRENYTASGGTFCISV